MTAELTRALTPGQRTSVLALLTAATETDQVAPLSEHGVLHVKHGQAVAPLDALVLIDGGVAGYAYLDSPDGNGEAAGELVVHPASRRRGLGTALVGALTQAAGPHSLRIWAHGNLPSAAALARSTGFERVRALHQLRRPLDSPVTEPSFADGVTLRTFRPGADEAAWLRLNARAFAKHPEQGAWTRRDLELRERERWFDPDGFLIAERDGVMVGFHWTKVHGNGLGEVYVLGVDPDSQAGGLGRALTLAGLGYLRGRGITEVMLYVDDENTAAMTMYGRLGFGQWRTDVMYSRPAPARLAANP